MMNIPTMIPAPSDRTLAMTAAGTFDDPTPMCTSHDGRMTEELPSLSTTALGREGKGKRATGRHAGYGTTPARRHAWRGPVRRVMLHGGGRPGGQETHP